MRLWLLLPLLLLSPGVVVGQGQPRRTILFDLVLTEGLQELPVIDQVRNEGGEKTGRD